MIRRLASDERGFALVLAVVTMLVLSSLTASVLFSVAVNGRSAYRTNQSAKAFALAEEGVAYAEGRLYTATTPGDWNNVPHTIISQDGGTIEYYGTLTGSTWTVYGIGTYAGISRTVKVQAPQPAATVTYDTTPWNYFYIDGGPTCTTIGGSTNTVNIPIYTHGSICLNGNADFTGSDLEVGGALTLIGGNAKIGKQGIPVSKLNVVGACSPGPPCAADTTPFFVSPPGIGHTIPVVNKPVVNFPTYYASTNPGPAAGHGCGAGSTGVPANFFDNDTTMNLSDGTIKLFPSSSYDCKGTNGEMIWNAGTSTLTFFKTGASDPQFYFDGNLALSGNNKYIYQGRAQLFFTGTILMTGQAKLCGIANCSTQWDNSTNQVFLFADCWKDSAGDITNVASGDAYCMDLQGQNILQANAWVNSDYHVGGNAADVGPVITTTAAIEGNPAQMIPLHNAPADLPGATTTAQQPAGAPFNWSG